MVRTLPAPNLSPTGLTGSGEVAVLPVLSFSKRDRPFGRALGKDFSGSAPLGFEELPLLPDSKNALVASGGLELLSPGTAVVSRRRGLLADRGCSRSAGCSALTSPGTRVPRRNALSPGLLASTPVPACSVWGEVPSLLLAPGLGASPSTGPSPRRADTAVGAAAGGIAIPPGRGGAAPAGQAEDGCLDRRRRCVGRGSGAADPAVAAGAPWEREALEVHPSALLCGQQLTPAASAPAGCLPLLRRGGPASGTSTLFLQSVGAGSQELRLLLLLRGSPVLFLQSTGVPTANAWHAGLSAQAAPFCGPLSPTAGAACCRSLAA